MSRMRNLSRWVSTLLYAIVPRTSTAQYRYTYTYSAQQWDIHSLSADSASHYPHRNAFRFRLSQSTQSSWPIGNIHKATGETATFSNEETQTDAPEKEDEENADDARRTRPPVRQ